MVKVEIRPGIFVRLTEEEARQRGLHAEIQPSHKAAEPQAAKPKKTTKAKDADVQPEAETVKEEASEEADSE